MADSLIHPGVELGKDVLIEPFCIIGLPPRGAKAGEIKTVIGDGAVIRSHTIIYAGSVIGKNFNTGHHVVIREHNEIGDNVSVGSLSCIEHHTVFESGVRVHSQAFIPEYSHLEKDAWIGPNVVLTNAPYPRSKGVKESLKGVHVERKALIGANVTLLPGVRIGRGALVGAGAVVVDDVAPETVVAGCPAIFIKSIREIKQYEEWLDENPFDES